MGKFIVYVRVLDGDRRKDGYVAFGDVDHLFTEDIVRSSPTNFLFELEDIVPQLTLSEWTSVLEVRVFHPKEMINGALNLRPTSISEGGSLDPEKDFDETHEAMLLEEIPGIDGECPQRKETNGAD